MYALATLNGSFLTIGKKKIAPIATFHEGIFGMESPHSRTNCVDLTADQEVKYHFELTFYACPWWKLAEPRSGPRRRPLVRRPPKLKARLVPKPLPSPRRSRSRPAAAADANEPAR